MKTVIIGLGTQRSGSTFFSKMIDSYIHCHPPLIKELHIFNAIELNLFKNYRITQKNLYLFDNKPLHLILKDHKGIYNRAIEVRSLRFKLQSNVDNYFLYFKNLLDNNSANISYDITPQYIGLEKETLKNIYIGFKKLNIKCKFVLIIRDPVERNWSATKQKFKKKEIIAWDHTSINPKNREGIDTTISLKDAFLNYSLSEYSNYFNNYKKIITNLRESIDRDDYLITFYEDIQTRTFKSKIENFLDIKIENFNIEKKINQSTEEDIENKHFAKIARHYSKTYEFCAQQYPELKNQWRGFKYL